MTLHNTRSRQIAALNDLARKTFRGCRVVLTEGILNMPDAAQVEILQRVRQYSCFTPQTDPYGEHDFGGFDFEGQRIFWKFDYQDKRSSWRLADPTDGDATERLLTILLAEEY